jgi:hypothetical protein
MRGEMKNRNLVGIAGMTIVLLFATTLAFAQSQAVPTSGPPEDGNIAWFLQGSFPDPEGATSVAADGKVTVTPRETASFRFA